MVRFSSAHPTSLPIRTTLRMLRKRPYKKQCKLLLLIMPIVVATSFFKKLVTTQADIVTWWARRSQFCLLLWPILYTRIVVVIISSVCRYSSVVINRAFGFCVHCQNGSCNELFSWRIIPHNALAMNCILLMF